jgi:hypothetical protein
MPTQPAQPTGDSFADPLNVRTPEVEAYLRANPFVASLLEGYALAEAQVNDAAVPTTPTETLAAAGDLGRYIRILDGIGSYPDEIQEALGFDPAGLQDEREAAIDNLLDMLADPAMPGVE